MIQKSQLIGYISTNYKYENVSLFFNYKVYFQTHYKRMGIFHDSNNINQTYNSLQRFFSINMGMDKMW